MTSSPTTPARRYEPQATYAAARALQALEVLAFGAASAPKTAALLGVHPRTARRLLATLVREGYLLRFIGPRRREYRPTVRVLTLAAQTARHLPLVTRGAAAVADLHARAGCRGAYVAVPCYRDVLVVAAAGRDVPAAWSLLPARECAAGRLLLAHREAWRHSQTNGPQLDRMAAEVRDRGYARTQHDELTTLAVPVESDAPPLAALAATASSDVTTAGEPELLAALRATADELTGKLRDDH